jgi:hypothetical protein
MVVKRKGKQQEDPDIILKAHGALVSTAQKPFRGIKNHLIKQWSPLFEQKYINSFKKLDENETDPKKVIEVISKRIVNHDFKNTLTIILQYSPADKFTILSTYTDEEREYEEFLKWKEKKKKV